ncbi:MAG: DUF58 domain-containing protein [Bdellovibrionales bacterium]|nr:DUF58 domain-containing protein [Bdellovibrionales bacterium]
MTLYKRLVELWRGPDASHLVVEFDENLALSQAKTQELQMSKLVSSEMSGDYASAFLGQGLSFSELRDYQPGDDPRNIQWNVTARFGKPFVKVFREERQLRVVLLLDISASMVMTPRYLQALQFGSLLFSVCQKNRDQIGFGQYGNSLVNFIPPKSSRTHYRTLLYQLNRKPAPQEKTNLGAAAKELRSKLPKHTTIIVVSDFEGDEGYEELEILAQGHDLTCLYIPESELPDQHLGLVRLKAPETGEYSTRDISASSYRASSEKTSLSNWRAIERKLRTKGARPVKFDQNAARTFQSLIHSRRKLRH